MLNNNDAVLGFVIGVLGSATVWLCSQAMSMWCENTDLRVKLERAEKKAEAATYR